MSNLIDVSLALFLCNYSNDAYLIIEDDLYFQEGFRTLDDHWFRVDSKDAWLKELVYTPIMNPASNVTNVRFWGIIAVADDAVIVAFRGTDFTSLGDIAIDVYGSGTYTDIYYGISFPLANWQVSPQDPVRVHKNFLSTYQSVQKSVNETLVKLFTANPKLKKLYITGHSLGGALATICALDVSVNLHTNNVRVPVPIVYTFASPLVGDRYFADLFSSHIQESYRFYFETDYVTQVPTRGWTPAWIKWDEGGRKGPEPVTYALFKHVTGGIALTTNTYFPQSHRLRAYYDAIRLLDPANVIKPVIPDTGFHKNDPIKNLSVIIKTADDWGAGTDNDVWCRMLDVSWGPLDTSANDFERGSEREYDLFAMFQNKIPSHPTIGQIDSLILFLGEGVFYFSVYDRAWKVERVTLKVNGKIYSGCTLNTWLYKPTDQVVCLITPPNS